MKALLVSGGDLKDLQKLKSLAKDRDYVIGVDKGAEYCLAANVFPDLVIGDLDSIHKEGLKIIRDKEIPIMKYPSEKNKTDTELAIDHLIDKNITDLVIIAAIGTRMDHTLGNIFLLKKLNDQGISCKIINKNNTIYIVDRDLLVRKKKNTYVSLLALNDGGAVISLKGFKYNLDRVKVEFPSTLAISNQIEEEYGFIKIHQGICLVFVTKD